MADPFAVVPLLPDYVPGEQTVVVGLPFSLPQRNQHLQRVLMENWEAYRAADNEGKQRIQQQIVEQVQRSTGNGIGFVAQSENGQWKALIHEAGCCWWVGVAFEYLAASVVNTGHTGNDPDLAVDDDNNADASMGNDDINTETCMGEPLSVMLEDSDASAASSLDPSEAQDIISRLSSPTPQPGQTGNATAFKQKDSATATPSTICVIRPCDVVMKEKSLRNTTEGTKLFAKCKESFSRSKEITYEEVFEKQKQLICGGGCGGSGGSGGKKQSDPFFWIRRDKLKKYPHWALEASMVADPRDWMLGYLEKGIYKGKPFVLASEACILHDIRMKRRKSDKPEEGSSGEASS